ncbi:hypothetical protein K438DRAFT_1777510 [Mycena galopus ATCC 62051]|nr:hypothetical protein K438DRAFT_1777510 [Mycena galopus ATCC 62051]
MYSARRERATDQFETQRKRRIRTAWNGRLDDRRDAWNKWGENLGFAELDRRESWTMRGAYQTLWREARGARVTKAEATRTENKQESQTEPEESESRQDGDLDLRKRDTGDRRLAAIDTEIEMLAAGVHRNRSSDRGGGVNIRSANEAKRLGIKHGESGRKRTNKAGTQEGRKGGLQMQNRVRAVGVAGW